MIFSLCWFLLVFVLCDCCGYVVVCLLVCGLGWVLGLVLFGVFGLFLD